MIVIVTGLFSFAIFNIAFVLLSPDVVFVVVSYDMAFEITHVFLYFAVKAPDTMFGVGILLA